jgi:NAD(P)-dependent dehydrogenase (short-subunit alcohol dehydrogenase family)
MQLQPRSLAKDYRGSGKLEGKVAIITGGDSGIGRAVVILFAREGAHVAIAYLNEDEDAQETCRLVEAEGGTCLPISGDVQDAAFCEGMVAKAVAKFGGINVLVNNAAFQEHAEHIEDITEQRLEESFQDERLWLLSYGQSRAASSWSGRLHYQHRFCDRPSR